MRADETLFYFAGLAGRIDADLVIRRARAMLHEFRSLPRIPCTLARICASSPTSTSTPLGLSLGAGSARSISISRSSSGAAAGAGAGGSETGSSTWTSVCGGGGGGLGGSGGGGGAVEPALDALVQAPTLWDTPYNPTVYCVGHTPAPGPSLAPAALAAATTAPNNSAACPFSAPETLST